MGREERGRVADWHAMMTFFGCHEEGEEGEGAEEEKEKEEEEEEEGEVGKR